MSRPVLKALSEFRIGVKDHKHLVATRMRLRKSPARLSPARVETLAIFLFLSTNFAFSRIKMKCLVSDTGVPVPWLVEAQDSPQMSNITVLFLPGVKTHGVEASILSAGPTGTAFSIACAAPYKPLVGISCAWKDVTIFTAAGTEIYWTPNYRISGTAANLAGSEAGVSGTPGVGCQIYGTSMNFCNEDFPCTGPDCQFKSFTRMEQYSQQDLTEWLTGLSGTNFNFPTVTITGGLPTSTGAQSSQPHQISSPVSPTSYTGSIQSEHVPTRTMITTGAGAPPIAVPSILSTSNARSTTVGLCYMLTVLVLISQLLWR
ncbi:hypothetical protein FH972_025553 [Carpinus fangiana]|uniref:Uncharacterized protein n=1 Tax=Carpinus fangiana TaxID=176857 RepID=A0A5N6L1G5_9ROSI|nr:hypothetical protein FH972_025553 [Carpinus fangiana]